MLERNCDICNKTFFTTGKTLVCSDACYVKRKSLYAKSYKIEKTLKKKCINCKKTFESKGKKFCCSDACTREKDKKYLKEYIKQAKENYANSKTILKSKPKA